MRRKQRKSLVKKAGKLARRMGSDLRGSPLGRASRGQKTRGFN